tara:strand:+ start:8642 stop:9751 length:1110 start_codon:yes stop_codon:yes gene_type:complete
MQNLVSDFHLDQSALGHLTSSVQFGFISGTLLFAILTIADRFSPSKVFLLSALFGALFNIGMIWEENHLTSLLVFRFFTGFFLAGIYPIGMKIAADYYEKGLGKSLGFLVGALALGTAFPHLLKGLVIATSWKFVLLSTSGLAVIGGALMMLFVPNGPFRHPSQKLDVSACFHVFKNSKFRSAAFGYFGHMWELYAFWAFVPVILSTYNSIYPKSALNVPILSFSIIGIGGIACVLGGYLSLKIGTKKTASMALLLSCLCCFISPVMFMLDSANIMVGFLFFWGMVVIADSPLFSTLVANNAPPKLKGTALTIVNCVGFSITILSIQVLTLLREFMNPTYMYMVLALGPLFGLVALYQKKEKKLRPTKD